MDKKKNLTFERNSTVASTDFTLKSTLSFLSQRSMDWIQDDTSGYCHTPLDSTFSSPTTSSTTSSALPSGDRFRRSLFYYRYPSSVPLQLASPSASITGHNGEEVNFNKANPFMVELRKSWCLALECAARMVLAAPGRTFTMYMRQFSLFVAHSDSGPVACINRTSLSFRKKLSQFGIHYTLPLVSVTKSENDDENLAPTSDQASIDDTQQSILLVRGHSSILLLVAFFADLYQGDSKWLGLCPTIASYFPFLHGSLCQVENSVASSKLVRDTGFEIVHTVTLTGLIMPEAFVDICSAMTSNLGESESFNFTCNTVPQTLWNGVALDAPLNDSESIEIDSQLGVPPSLGCIVSGTLRPDSILYSYNIKN